MQLCDVSGRWTGASLGSGGVGFGGDGGGGGARLTDAKWAAGKRCCDVTWRRAERVAAARAG